MKQLFLLPLLFLFAFYAQGQLTKNNWLVSGAGSFYSYTENYSLPTYNETDKYTTIDISASIGYFIVDKFATGLRPSFSSYKGRTVSASNGQLFSQ